MSWLHFPWPWSPPVFPWSSILIISATSWIFISWLDTYCICWAHTNLPLVLCTHFTSHCVLLRGLHNYVAAEIDITVFDYRVRMILSYHTASESTKVLCLECLIPYDKIAGGPILLLLLYFMKIQVNEIYIVQVYAKAIISNSLTWNHVRISIFHFSIHCSM